MRVTCKHCGGAHPAFDCKKSTGRENKPVANGDVPAASLGLVDRATSAKQAVDTNSERRENEGFGSFTSKNVSGTTSAGTVGNEDRQPIPKRKRGRPRIIIDMRAYKAAKQREYRERKKNAE